MLIYFIVNMAGSQPAMNKLWLLESAPTPHFASDHGYWRDGILLFMKH